MYIVYKRTLYINIAKSAIEELGLSLPFSLKYLHPAKKYIGMNWQEMEQNKKKKHIEISIVWPKRVFGVNVEFTSKLTFWNVFRVIKIPNVL